MFKIQSLKQFETETCFKTGVAVNRIRDQSKSSYKSLITARLYVPLIPASFFLAALEAEKCVSRVSAAGTVLTCHR